MQIFYKKSGKRDAKLMSEGLPARDLGKPVADLAEVLELW